jgi:hypothetical protein
VSILCVVDRIENSKFGNRDIAKVHVVNNMRMINNFCMREQHCHIELRFTMKLEEQRILEKLVKKFMMIKI